MEMVKTAFCMNLEEKKFANCDSRNAVIHDILAKPH
jgi:hypothetical protein